VARGTDFYVEVAMVGAAGGKRVTTGALHLDFFVLGVGCCFHSPHPSVNADLISIARRGFLRQAAYTVETIALTGDIVYGRDDAASSRRRMPMACTARTRFHARATTPVATAMGVAIER